MSAAFWHVATVARLNTAVATATVAFDQYIRTKHKLCNRESNALAHMDKTLLGPGLHSSLNKMCACAHSTYEAELRRICMWSSLRRSAGNALSATVHEFRIHNRVLARKLLPFPNSKYK